MTTNQRTGATEFEDGLLETFELQAALNRFSGCLESYVDFDRWGIATRVNRSELEVLALYDRGKMQPGKRGHRFSYRGTVGEWVWRRKQRFIGKQRAEVRAFPSTFKQFEHDGMQSNCVIPLPLPGRGPTLAYWMSRRPGRFNSENVGLLQRACEYLKILVIQALEIERVHSLAGNPLERAISHLFVDASAQDSSATTLPTLDEFQRQYIQRVLRATNWSIEGATGAAAVLGLPASTLRSRMKKLDIRRD